MNNPFQALFQDLFSLQVTFDEYQTKDEFVFIGDVGGVKKEDLSIDLENNTIVIKGSRACNPNVEPLMSERWCGSFQRAFRIPSLYVDQDKVSAVLKDGVLEVRLPKLPKDHHSLKNTSIVIKDNHH
ncbi:heat shock protein Hsp20 domain-containing protein [Cavenderia fasciculata]|uniref:Heat shock protein Hsp20 domain-containing protein n=1 Tax=Cavenderia fasciculata TaxID=261658 RepID=F4PRN1_CACFS|nr:heat shock protein Hsp20 domain-containing protein [Cavenderia fasciculata]EGG20530.1 heat shock protein Hsp20 domain-containing protein [Cavenderia fasciculata]|eukprot:XP_004358380.1 heat shock protein Hsp20 domain-containing protein [Cavenderia fasciculata]